MLHQDTHGFHSGVRGNSFGFVIERVPEGWWESHFDQLEYIAFAESRGFAHDKATIRRLCNLEFLQSDNRTRVFVRQSCIAQYITLGDRRAVAVVMGEHDERALFDSPPVICRFAGVVITTSLFG